MRCRSSAGGGASQTPNRVIKESVCTSDSLASVSPEAERLFWRLVVRCDDFGRYEARPTVVLGTCLTAFVTRFTPQMVEEWLDEIEEAGLIARYEVKGKDFLSVLNWRSHQNPRSLKSKYPAPPWIDGSGAVFPEEKDVEGILYASIQTKGYFNGELVIQLDRQLRAGEKYLDIFVRTQSGAYVLELKRGRLSRKAIDQIQGYLSEVDARGVLIGAGLASNFSLEECASAGIAVVTYAPDMSFSCQVDGGFLTLLPTVDNREITRNHVGSHDALFGNGNGNGNENGEEEDASAPARADAASPDFAAMVARMQGSIEGVTGMPLTDAQQDRLKRSLIGQGWAALLRALERLRKEWPRGGIHDPVAWMTRVANDGAGGDEDGAHREHRRTRVGGKSGSGAKRRDIDWDAEPDHL